ncbi:MULTISPECIES: hypothetical protein, partial [Streptococcus]
YFYGQADDVFRQHGLETKYKLTSDVTLGGVVYYHDYGSEGKRTLTNANAGKRNFDKDAWHFAGTMEWRIPESAWTIRTGVT